MKKWTIVVALVVGSPTWAGATDNSTLADSSLTAADAAEPTNVNARYIIEGVNISGSESRSTIANLSSSLKAELKQVVGANLDSSKLDKLASRIKDELKATRVKIHVTKGTRPEHVLVNFEVAKKPVDLKVAKFLYDSEQGWSGEGTAATHFGGNIVTLGLTSDCDDLLERYAGIRAKFERDSLFTDRLGMVFEFDDFHEMWNPAVATAAEPELYRSRQVFAPEARVKIAGPLELDLGVRFARYRLSTPDPAETESSNAVVSTLRYHQRWGSGIDIQEQQLDASYSLESAMRLLSTDADYTRNLVQAHYKFRHDRNHVDVAFMTGLIQGQAPLFDRFVLGNAEVLRGWNKFELDPLGGSHMVYGSVEYTYRYYQVFYDNGAVWDRAQDCEPKQSVGAGFKKDGFQLAVAFPLRTVHPNPIFFAGMNF